ncbi:MAG: roadblock/LC7 domain-containing protein [Kiritimatiellia bacterium]|nr:roadblock/LC7 domain-containing protein [Kiritimatiellia bacterium]
MAQSLVDQDVQRIRGILQELLTRSEADGCVVCDSGGYVLAKEGRGSGDPLVVSALGAGVFAASRELARILGEDEFSAVFHQGERKSIFIRAVTTEVLLVVIFSNAGSIGLVRLYATPAASEMRQVLESARSRESTDDGLRSFVLSADPVLFSGATRPAE